MKVRVLLMLGDASWEELAIGQPGTFEQVTTALMASGVFWEDGIGNRYFAPPNRIAKISKLEGEDD